MSFLQLYQDFLQKKEGENRFSAPGNDSSAAEDQQRSMKGESSETLKTPLSLASSNSTHHSSRTKKMEHSYMRAGAESRSMPNADLAPARTILLRCAGQCSSCHTHPMDEDEMQDDNKVPVPGYNEKAAKDIMNECARIAQCVPNSNPDDEIWEERIVKHNWTPEQRRLFDTVSKILDKDYLGRLANHDRQHEAMLRRCVVDASTSRFRKALANVQWDVRLTQWLHGLLMENLPATYMGSYLDILQTLKSKVPSLMEKMLFGRPMNFSQELLTPVLKPRWEITVCQKSRKLSQQIVIILIPGNFGLGKTSERFKKWQQQLSSFAEVVTIALPMNSAQIMQQPLEDIGEQVVSLTRVKIQELRNEIPARSIFLVGLNASAAMALQVAMSVSVSAVICLGFAYNTTNGVRGAPDDRLLDIKVPILFVIGQNSARTSQEEMESLRERLQSESSLLVVGSADDVLRIPKSRRCIECVTQSMVDTMIVDEVFEYIQRILAHPPGPRTPIHITGLHTRVAKNTPLQNVTNDGNMHSNSADGKFSIIHRKRKVQEIAGNSGNQNDTSTPKTKIVSTKNPNIITSRNMQNENDGDIFYNWAENELQRKTPLIIKRKVGRPRFRPVTVGNSSTTVNKSITKQVVRPIASNVSLTDDMMTEAMQSILDDDDEPYNTSNNSNNSNQIVTFVESPSSTAKTVTNYELVAEPSKTSPLKPQVTNVSPSTSSAKIKIIPSNQFVPLKPGGLMSTGHLQTPTQIYTIKNTTPTGGTSIGSIVSTPGNSQPQIIRLKTTPTSMGKSKFTIIKNNSRPSFTNATTSVSPQKPTVDISSIINLPIIFADQQGNLTEAMHDSTVPATSNETTSAVATSNITTSRPMKLNIINQKIFKPSKVEQTSPVKQSTVIIGGQTYLINKSANEGQKMIVVNQTPATSNVLGRQTYKYATTLPPGAQIVPISAASAVSGLKPMGINTSSTSTASPVQTIKLLNTAGGGGNTVSGVRNVVLKPGNFRQFPAHMKTQLLNRTVNIRDFTPGTKINSFIKIPMTATTTASTSSSLGETHDSNVVVPPSPRQSAPKIITIEPLDKSLEDDLEEYSTMSIDD